MRENMARADYHLIDGQVLSVTSSISMQDLSEIYRDIQTGRRFVGESGKTVYGMFKIRTVHVKNKRIVLDEVECDPKYWTKNQEGVLQGPDQDCKENCEFYLDCPISEYKEAHGSG